MGSVGAAFATEGANNKLGDFRRIPVQMSGADKLLNGRVEPFDFQTACAFRTEELIQGQSRVQAQRNRGERKHETVDINRPASVPPERKIFGICAGKCAAQGCLKSELDVICIGAKLVQGGRLRRAVVKLTTAAASVLLTTLSA